MLPPKYYPYSFIDDLRDLQLDSFIYRVHMQWPQENYPPPDPLPILIRIKNQPEWYRRHSRFLEAFKSDEWRRWQTFRSRHRDVHDEIYTIGAMQRYSPNARLPDDLNTHIPTPSSALDDISFSKSMHYRCPPRIGDPKIDIQVHRIPLPSLREPKTSRFNRVKYTVPYKEERRAGWFLNIDQPRYNYILYLLWRAYWPGQHRRMTLDNFMTVSKYIRKEIIEEMLNDEELVAWLHERGERMIVQGESDEEAGEEEAEWSDDEDMTMVNLPLITRNLPDSYCDV